MDRCWTASGSGWRWRSRSKLLRDVASSSLHGAVPGVQPGSNAVEEPIRDLAFRQQRPGLGRCVRSEQGDSIGVGPEARAGFGHVVGDEQVDTLALELLDRPLERAGLGGEADQDRGRPKLAGNSN